MIVADLLQKARDAGVMIATAESCTGGMVAAALTDIAGSSDVFDRGFVTYSNAAKMAMLGVRAQTLTDHGAVSEPVAVEMAEGALTRSLATLAVSITGIAGPGGSEFKPEGRVCFAVAQRGSATRVETVEFGAPGRAKVRIAARDHALAMIGQALSGDQGAEIKDGIGR
jgi:nicotinamide-nucleotide amidase